jgi:hypothetical protein
MWEKYQKDTKVSMIVSLCMYIDRLTGFEVGWIKNMIPLFAEKIEPSFLNITSCIRYIKCMHN